MATPIRETPILTGKDAVWFNRRAEQIPPLEVRRANRARVEEGVERLKKFLQSLPK